MAASGTELAILPVGATEQHGSYLPLATDSLEAEAVARGVAERLDAFLLPVLPFSNSEAHAGFRGSVVSLFEPHTHQSARAGVRRTRPQDQPEYRAQRAGA